MAEKTTREHLHEIIFEADTPAGKAFDVVLLILILLSVLVVILESVSHIDILFHDFFYVLEWILTILFTFEYLIRIAVVKRPRVYIFSFYGIIDLLSILPTYLSLIFVDTHYLLTIRALRLLRVFRVFKLTRYLADTEILVSALKASRHKIFVFLSAIFLMVIVLGSLMYLVEGGQGSGFDSIPRSMYWAIVTLTTVGYGDIAPVTPLGQFISAIIMIMGYSIIAVPTGIVSAELAASRAINFLNNTQVCQSCGFDKHADDAKYCKRCGHSLMNH